MLTFGEEKLILDFGNMIYEDTIKDDQLIRNFHEEIDEVELKWHRDEETRIIVSLNETDWQIQLENSLPCSLNSITVIPAMYWHRLIKGTGDLSLKIVKL